MRALLSAALTAACYIFVSFFIYITPTPPLFAKTFQFQNKTIQQEAENYLKRISHMKASQQLEAGQWRAFATKTADRDPSLAAQYFETAHFVRGNSPQSWLTLAHDLFGLKFSARKAYQQSEIYLRASSAAYNAFLSSNDTPYKATALSLLGTILAKRAYWRPALNAYKASLALLEDAPTRLAYQKLQAEKGFRITNYNVNSNAANPRLCIQFSENLFYQRD